MNPQGQAPSHWETCEDRGCSSVTTDDAPPGETMSPPESDRRERSPHAASFLADCLVPCAGSLARPGMLRHWRSVLCRTPRTLRLSIRPRISLLSHHDDRRTTPAKLVLRSSGMVPGMPSGTSLRSELSPSRRISVRRVCPAQHPSTSAAATRYSRPQPHRRSRSAAQHCRVNWHSAGPLAHRSVGSGETAAIRIDS